MAYERLEYSLSTGHDYVQQISKILFISYLFKKGHSWSLFSFFQQFTVYMFIVQFRQWLDSNHGPLVLEATALPTEPQPLLIHLLSWRGIVFINYEPSNKFLRNLSKFFLCVGMPYNWSFYHPGPIEGKEGGILLIHYSMINANGLTFYI